jgi:transcriptional regulator with XRE-family HTH domain
MPPRNPPRTLTGEHQLAERVAHERERRGWSYEQLAQRMTDAGCPMNQSAINKIEKGSPRRRITVDELLGFAKVFETNISDLVLDRSVVQDARAAQLFKKWQDAEARATGARLEANAAAEEFERYTSLDPSLVQRVMQAASGSTVWPDNG